MCRAEGLAFRTQGIGLRGLGLRGLGYVWIQLDAGDMPQCRNFGTREELALEGLG